MGADAKKMESHKTYIGHGRVDIHRDQAGGDLALIQTLLCKSSCSNAN